MIMSQVSSKVSLAPSRVPPEALDPPWPCLEKVFITFVAGSPSDPRPGTNPLERRLARCLSCPGLRIVHYSAPYWTDGSGSFHTFHLLEVPRNWIPSEAIPK